MMSEDYTRWPSPPIKRLLCVFQELVSEKLRTQQMNNDLEKLTHELEKIGLNKERLLHDEGSDDRYLKHI